MVQFLLLIFYLRELTLYIIIKRVELLEVIYITLKLTPQNTVSTRSSIKEYIFEIVEKTKYLQRHPIQEKLGKRLEILFFIGIWTISN